MFCCQQCFRDSEIENYIITNSTQEGNCDFCQRTDVKIIRPEELNDYFQELISVYQECENLINETNSNLLLHERIVADWPKLFKINDFNILKRLLANILMRDEESDLLNKFVEVKYSTDDTQEESWEKFVGEIKEQNRFFIANTVNLKLLENLFKAISKPYMKGKLFYRARISPKNGYKVEEMGKPPHDKAVAGRANPKGISYLYLSSDTNTTLYETRATIYDYVSVSEFKLLKDINVVALRDTTKVSPLFLDDLLEEYLKYKKYLLRLESELAKPIRRQDSELDYLPTQYLCEFIKSLGFDGVEYRSSLNPSGFNLAIFNDQLLECVTVGVYEIDSINFDISRMK